MRLTRTLPSKEAMAMLSPDTDPAVALSSGSPRLGASVASETA